MKNHYRLGLLTNLNPGTALKKIVTSLWVLLLTAGSVLAQTEICNNGLDDDGDFLTDCQDPDCAGQTNCQISANCSEPYLYYLPPVYGDKTASCDIFGSDDIVLSTLGKTATVQIKRGDGALIQTVTVPTGDPLSVSFLNPADAANPARPASNQVLRGELNTVLSNAGLIISSDQPLQASYRMLSRPGCQTYNQDLLQMQGKASLGISFYAASQTVLAGSNVTYNGALEKHFVSVMATEDNTSITFTLPTALNLEGSPNHTADPTPDWTGTRTITLNKGQTYMIGTPNEAPNVTITGLRVTSTKPVVVNSGSQHTRHGNGGGDADAGIQQLIPTTALETQYIAIDGGNAGNDPRDYVVIVAIENGTSVQVNGTTIATLNAGEYYTHRLPVTPLYNSAFIQANNRIYVYHAGTYGAGEFGMDILPPINTCIGSKKIDFDKPGTEAKAVIIVPTSGLGSLKFNGASYTASALTVNGNLANTVSSSGYSYVVVPDARINSATNNRVTCNEKFHVSVISRTGGTGNYAFDSDYEKSVGVLDPATMQPTVAYQAGEVSPGTAFQHCLIITGCGTNNNIIGLHPVAMLVPVPKEM